MEGMALIQIGTHGCSLTNVIYPTVTPADVEHLRLVNSFAPIYKKLRTIKECEEGLRTLRAIRDNVIKEGAPLQQDHLSSVRLLYIQFEDLLWYLLAMMDKDITAYARQASRVLMSIHKASNYFAAYVREASHLLSVVDMRDMEEVD